MTRREFITLLGGATRMMAADAIVISELGKGSVFTVRRPAGAASL
jgi:hypothetical protein